MLPSYVLVHSPLIGPASWRPVADQLASRGESVTVPSLLSVLGRSSGFADAIALAVASHLTGSRTPDPILLVAHSAAGAFLPIVGSPAGVEVFGYILVDARLPEPGKSLSAQDSPKDQARLQGLARDGVLPAWSEWFGPDAMAEALPDPNLRRRFIEELRPIPLALFDEPISVPPSWPNAPCAYLRLSQHYLRQAREARARGWLVREVDAAHLYPMTHPEEVATLLQETAAGLWRA